MVGVDANRDRLHGTVRPRQPTIAILSQSAIHTMAFDKNRLVLMPVQLIVQGVQRAQPTKYRYANACHG
jgi:hypothetical protein